MDRRSRRTDRVRRNTPHDPIRVTPSRRHCTNPQGRCAKSLRSDRELRQTRPDRVTSSRRLQPNTRKAEEEPSTRSRTDTDTTRKGGHIEKTRRDNEAENPKEPQPKPVMQTWWRRMIVAVVENPGRRGQVTRHTVTVNRKANYEDERTSRQQLIATRLGLADCRIEHRSDSDCHDRTRRQTSRGRPMYRNHHGNLQC